MMGDRWHFSVCVCVCGGQVLFAKMVTMLPACPSDKGNANLVEKLPLSGVMPLSYLLPRTLHYNTIKWSLYNPYLQMGKLRHGQPM